MLIAFLTLTAGVVVATSWSVGALDYNHKKTGGDFGTRSLSPRDAELRPLLADKKRR